MPSPREPSNPPARNRRRPDNMPSGWLWLILLFATVLGLVYFVASGQTSQLWISDVKALAQEGLKPGAEENSNIKSAVFNGDKLEGELQEGAKLTEVLKEKMHGNKRFTAEV